jgi:hypothetical protein
VLLEVILFTSRPRNDSSSHSHLLAIYVGKKNVERRGRYAGKLSKDCFKSSFQLLAEKYARLRDQSVSTGKPSSEITPVIPQIVWDGKRQEITDRCPGLDVQLWSFESSIRGVASDVNWIKEESKNN